MFKRKNKTPAIPEREQRRARANTQPLNPAFSYYTSRTPDTAARRSQGQRQEAQKQDGQPNRPRRRMIAQVPLWLLLVLAVVCLVKLLLLGTNPKVVVLGKTTVSASYLQSPQVYQTAAHQTLDSSITNRTKITADLAGTADQLRRQFPELQAVSVTLPLIGNRPIVYVQVAQPSVIVQSTEGNFALNKSGVALARVSAIPAGVPTLVDQTGAVPHPGHQYLPGSTISFIQTVAYQFAAAKLSVAAYVLPAGRPYELDVRLEGKPYVVRFNLAAEALTQSGAAIATLQHLGGSQPVSYLDVRVPDRVYYK